MENLNLESAKLVDIEAEKSVTEKTPQELARELAERAVINFRTLYPEYLRLIDVVTGTDAKKILRLGFRMPFLKEPISFNRPELDRLYAISCQIREVQDIMVMVGGILGDTDPQSASLTAEKVALELEANSTSSTNKESESENV